MQAEPDGFQFEKHKVLPAHPPAHCALALPSALNGIASRNFNFPAIRAIALNRDEPIGSQSERAKVFSRPPPGARTPI